MEEDEEEDAEQDEVEGNEGNKPGISHLTDKVGEADAKKYRQKSRFIMCSPCFFR